MQSDWHREDIKAAIRKTGTTLRALALDAGYSTWSASVVLSKPWPNMEAVVARRLRCHPAVIWPSRYDANGAPLRGHCAVFRMKPTPRQTPLSRQKRAPA